MQQIWKRHESLENEHSLHIQDMLPVIKTATADLRQAMVDCLAAAHHGLETVNKRRWRSDPEAEAKCLAKFDASVSRLQTTLMEFKETKRKLLIEPYMPILNGALTKEERRKLPLRSLYLAYVFATNIMLLGDVLLIFMEKTGETLTKRKKNRLWAPKGLRAIAKIFTDKSHVDEAAEFGENPMPEKSDAEKKEETYRQSMII